MGKNYGILKKTGFLPLFPLYLPLKNSILHGHFPSEKCFSLFHLSDFSPFHRPKLSGGRCFFQVTCRFPLYFQFFGAGTTFSPAVNTGKIFSGQKVKKPSGQRLFITMEIVFLQNFSKAPVPSSVIFPPTSRL